MGCFECGRGKYISTEGATSETQCSLCPVGKSSPATDLPSTCESCPSGGYAPGKGYAMCAICPQNTISDETSTSCITQPGYYVDPDGEIVQAPDGVSKDVGGMQLMGLSLAPGYWRTNSNSTEILPCLNEDHCVGGSDPSSYCAEGYTGPLCAVCSSGYAAVGAGESLSCNQCSGSSTATVTIGISFIVLLLSAALVYKLSNRSNVVRGRLESIDSALTVASEKFEKVQPIIKIIFAYFQVVGGLGFLFGIKFPPIYSRVTSFVGGLFSLDFISFLPLGCMFPASFYNTLLAYTLFPLLLSIVLIAIYFVLHKRTDKRSVSLRNNIFEVFLAMTFILLPGVSVKIFSTFACHEFDDGTSYLKVDYGIDCNASSHTFYTLFAGIMILIYPIGVPFSYWFLLWRQRHLLNGGQRDKEVDMSEEKALEKALEEREANEKENTSLASLTFLYGSYEPKYWWFEVFETVRKLALTGFLVFLVPGTAAQVLFSMIMCIGAMRVYSGSKPFIDESIDRFSEVAQWQLFFTLLGALAMKVNLDNENLQDRGYFDIVLTCIQFIPVAIVTGFNVVMTRRAAKADDDEISPLGRRGEGRDNENPGYWSRRRNPGAEGQSEPQQGGDRTGG